MIAAIFGPEVFVVLLALTALGIWAAIDASTKPTWAFQRAGQSKALWIALPVIGIFLCGLITLVAAIMWFASIRPKVIAALSGGYPSQ